MKLITSEFQPYLDAAVQDPSLTVKSSEMKFYPYVDFTTKAPSIAAAMVCRVVDGIKEHTVVLALNVDATGKEVISLWCSDKFVDTRLTRDEAETRARSCAEGAGLVGPQVEAMVLKLMESFGLHGESGTCGFWAGWRGKKQLCSHTSTVLAVMRDTRPDILQELRTLYQTKSNLPVIAVRGDTFSLTEMAFRIPVLIEGDRGAGKTFTSRALAEDNGYGYVEAAGHEGLEAADLYGFLVPVAGYEGLVWQDGPLSEAFRRAQHEKTVLVLDELLRIPQRQLSVLLTALSPTRRGTYRLRTGRVVRVVDGVGEVEILEVPVSNLAVIATTNVGNEYAVDSLDPALAERFIILRMDTDVGQLAVILSELAKVRGFTAKSATNLVEFFKKMVTAKTNGMVAETPTTRTLCRALELAESEADVVRATRSQILLWVARDADGHPVKQQIDAVTTVLDAIFGKTKKK